MAEIVLGLGTSHTPMLMSDDEDLDKFPEWDVIVARLDKEGVRGKVDYTERVIRDKHYKVWVSEQRKISQLYDLISDPFEKNNLIGSTKPEHLIAIRKFQAVVDWMPEKDARPQYQPRKSNPWDRKLPKT